MEFKSLKIKNFRNFQSIDIELANRNVIFGMNDTGKTNLLSAIRFVLDREVRKNGLVASDYYKNDTSKPIEIILELSLADREQEIDEALDSRFLIAKVGNARRNDSNLDKFFIKLTAEYDAQELYGTPIMTWGDDLEELYQIPRKGEFYDLDKIFKVVYLDPLIDLDNSFKRYRRILFNGNKKSDNDLEIEKQIKDSINKLNSGIGDLDVVRDAQGKLTKAYLDFKDEGLSIELKSQIVIDGYMNDLVPYIRWNDDDNYYPTSGDGRKKVLAYAVTNCAIASKYDDKIIIYLIEEPENSLHRSMQISLSKQIFNNNIYRYFFLTTHSAELLYEMDRTQLIRITNEAKEHGFSQLYKVPTEYKNMKKRLNKGLSNALFYEKVLLVEGGSEFVLFEAVLACVCPTYEQRGYYLMQVDGISFDKYINMFNPLGIKWVVKTDNDLKAKGKNSSSYDLIGFNRCLELLRGSKMEAIEIDIDDSDLTEAQKKNLIKEQLIAKKRDIYDVKQNIVKEFESNGIYLSRVDLENDLFESLGKELNPVVKKLTKKNPIAWLQDSKLYNMVELVSELDETMLQKIYNNMPVLKGFIDNDTKNID